MPDHPDARCPVCHGDGRCPECGGRPPNDGEKPCGYCQPGTDGECAACDGTGERAA